MTSAVRSYPLLAFFLLAYLISWMIWLPLYLPYLHLPILPFQHAYGAIGPCQSAFIVASVINQKKFDHLIQGIIKWRVNVIWYLIALLGPYILLLIAETLNYIRNSDPILMYLETSPEFPQFSFLGFFIYNLFSFGLGEEIGWRGFALPQLQTKYSLLKSTLILSIFWAGWHLPLFFYRPGYSSMGGFEIIGWLMSIFTGAILLTWLYNGTNGSILIVSLFHATIDMPFTSVKNTDELNIMGALITIWGIIVALYIFKKTQKVPS